MEKEENNSQEYFTIDTLHILRSLWSRIWIIILAGVVAAIAGFCISAFAVSPTYSSFVKLYVNNSSLSLGTQKISISSSDLTASQSLVKTYGEILNSRSTLERIIEKAGIDYSWKELSKMIVCGNSNNTEIMKVTVTCGDPYEASKIANTVAEVLPLRISEIIDGASMEIVDSAVPDLAKVSPSIKKYTAVGFLAGIFAAALVLAALAVIDDTIYDEEYILRTYDYPILGKVPDLLDTGSKTYGYRYQNYYKSAGGKKN
ncbi:MAG: hypothetical protein J5933_02770 [Clostridia bacterium]|nr:hypothetical protein [Clostridia bacterium]